MNDFEISPLITGIVIGASGLLALSVVAVGAARDYARAREAMKRVVRVSSEATARPSNSLLWYLMARK